MLLTHIIRLQSRRTSHHSLLWSWTALLEKREHVLRVLALVNRWFHLINLRLRNRKVSWLRCHGLVVQRLLLLLRLNDQGRLHLCACISGNGGLWRSMVGPRDNECLIWTPHINLLVYQSILANKRGIIHRLQLGR